MLERLSDAYYLGRFYVEPATGDHARIRRDRHEEANALIYAAGRGIERLDLPLVMKLGPVHFPVFAGEGVRADTLELPASVLAEAGVEDPPALREVLLATAERAGHLLRWFTPYRIDPSGGRRP